jgi:hypothetical protein
MDALNKHVSISDVTHTHVWQSYCYHRNGARSPLGTVIVESKFKCVVIVDDVWDLPSSPASPNHQNSPLRALCGCSKQL